MFNTLIYTPILNLLIFIYQNIAFHDLGIAIIILTFIVRIVLYPLFWKSTKDQVAMQKIQPELQRIQKEKKNKPEEQAKALMELYKTNKVNPLSSIFIMLLQLPIFFALFKIFNTEVIQGTFDNVFLFGVINLKEKGLDFALIAALLQYLQFKMTSMAVPKNKESGDFQRFLPFMIPVFTFFVLLNLPRAISFYWGLTTIFSIIQQYFMTKKEKK